MVELVSYPLALISGYNVLETSTRKSCYKNLALQGLFDDMQKGRKQEYQRLFSETAKQGSGDVVEAISALESKYRIDVRHKLESLGMHGLGDYWKVLKRNQKQDALMLTATVSGVVLGAMYTLADHSWVKKLGSVIGLDHNEAKER